jgi:hypothetical protein
MTNTRALAALLALLFCSAAHTQAPAGDGYRQINYKVIELKYADAEELALVLTAVLPAGVTVVPYAPTNSLIVSWPSVGKDDSGKIRDDQQTAALAEPGR